MCPSSSALPPGFVELFYSTGMRRTELVNLQLNDVDISKSQLKVLGKRNKERFIPLLQTVLDTYKGYMAVRSSIKNSETSKFIFLTKNGLRVYDKLVYRVIINYFDTTPANTNIPFSYYKNMCPDPANNYYFKGRCYDNCPNGYESMGLGCILSSQKDKLFNPDSNFCNQVCSASNNDLNSFDSVIQKACWCKSMSCDKCGEYSIDNCKC